MSISLSLEGGHCENSSTAGSLVSTNYNLRTYKEDGR